MAVLTLLNLEPSLWWRSGHFTAAFQPVLKSVDVTFSGGRDQGPESPPTECGFCRSVSGSFFTGRMHSLCIQSAVVITDTPKTR